MTSTVAARSRAPPHSFMASATRANDSMLDDVMNNVLATHGDSATSSQHPVGVLESQTIITGVPAAAPLATGAAAATLRLEGMTMRVPNPNFVGLEEQYREMRKRLRLAEMTRRQVQTWIDDALLTRTTALQADPVLLDTLSVTEADVREVIAAGQQVRKPPRVADERSQRRRRLLLSVFNGEQIGADVEAFDPQLDDVVFRRADDDDDDPGALINGALNEFEATIIDEQKKNEGVDDDTDADEAARIIGVIGTRVASTINATIERIVSEVQRADFSESALTAEELRATFTSFANSEVYARRRQRTNRVERLPFGATSDTEREQLELYYRQTIESNVVAEMLVDVGNDRTSMLAEWKENAALSGIDKGDIGAVERYITSLVSGDEASVTPSAAALAQQRLLRTDDDVRDEWLRDVLDMLRLEMALTGLGDAGANIDGDELARLRIVRRERSAMQRASEEALRVQRARVAFEVHSVRAGAEAAVARYRYELSKVDREIVVPLEVTRRAGSLVPLDFTVELVPRANAAVDVEDATYTFEWFYYAGGDTSSNNVRLRNVVKQASARDTFVVAAPSGEAGGGGGAYLDGDGAGVYWVRVTRDVAGAVDGVFESPRALVRVVARCLRCDDDFYAGDMQQRVFGECEWRARPVDAALLKYRNSSDFEPFIAALGQDVSAASGYDFRADLDDSIINYRTGTLVLDDKSLLRVANLRSDDVARRYFEFESIVRNIAERLPRYARQRYGATATAALRQLLAVGVGNKVGDDTTMFIGAVYQALEPPPTSILAAADAALEPIEVRVDAFTNQLLAAMNNNAPLVEQRAAARARLQAVRERDQADLFRAEVLRPMVDNLRQQLDARMNMSDVAVLDAADATANAKTPADVPVVALVHALVGSVPSVLTRVVTRSERRFFGEMAGRMGAFATAFRASSSNAELLTSFERRRFARTGRPIQVLGTTPMLGAYVLRPSSQRRDERAAAERVAAERQAAVDRRRSIDAAAIDRGRATRATLAASGVAQQRMLDLQRRLAIAQRTNDRASVERLQRDVRALSARQAAAVVARPPQAQTRVDAERQVVQNLVVGARVARKRVRAYEPPRELAVTRRRTTRGAGPRRDVPNERGDDATTVDEALMIDTSRLADQLLATQSASQLRASPLWHESRTRDLMGLGAYTSSSFFFDSVGERRLAERLKSAEQRTQMSTRAQRHIDETSSTATESTLREIELSASLGRPLGVPLNLWVQLGNEASRSGVAATANEARRIVALGGLTRTTGALDWRGYHSSSNDQPAPYEVEFFDDAGGVSSAARVVRGSERLFSGYDFTSIHRRITLLVAEYRRAPDASKAQLRQRIERLALYYNVVAQFAPKLQTLGVANVDVIEAALENVRAL